jgi:hypothetical protein
MVEVNIEEVASTMQVTDGDALLSPRTLRTIVNAVMRAIEERESHQRRVQAEQCIGGGVREELERER